MHHNYTLVYRFYKHLFSFNTHLNKRGVTYIKSEIFDNEIQVLTLSDTKRANSLSLPLLNELNDAIKSLQNLKTIRALIITGEGKYFSTGHNLKELITCSQKDVKLSFTTCSNVMQAISELPFPSIAAVNGPAVAAGCQLVASCDLAISNQSAFYSTPGIKLGLFCSTPGVSLVRAIGMRAARELLYTGRQIDANRAYELGLVHRVVSDDDLITEAFNFAREITQHSKDAIVLGKKTLCDQANMHLPDAYRIASEAMTENLNIPDAQNGIKSFLNKSSSKRKQ